MLAPQIRSLRLMDSDCPPPHPGDLESTLSSQICLSGHVLSMQSSRTQPLGSDCVTWHNLPAIHPQCSLCHSCDPSYCQAVAQQLLLKNVKDLYLLTHMYTKTHSQGRARTVLLAVFQVTQLIILSSVFLL